MASKQTVESLTKALTKIQKDECIHITLNFKNAREFTEARKSLFMYIRKLKKFYKEQGKFIKYIAVTHQSKGKEKYHHHIIINQPFDTKMQKLWRNGWFRIDEYLRKRSPQSLANYLLKDIEGYYIISKSINNPNIEEVWVEKAVENMEETEKCQVQKN